MQIIYLCYTAMLYFREERGRVLVGWRIGPLKSHYYSYTELHIRDSIREQYTADLCTHIQRRFVLLNYKFEAAIIT